MRSLHRRQATTTFVQPTGTLSPDDLSRRDHDKNFWPSLRRKGSLPVRAPMKTPATKKTPKTGRASHRSHPAVKRLKPDSLITSTGQQLALDHVTFQYPDSNVNIVAYSRGQVGPPGKLHIHTNEDWEICYLANGVADYQLGTEKLQLHAGDVLVMSPDDPHVCHGWRGERFVTIFRHASLRETAVPIHCGRAMGLEVAGVRIPPRTQVVPWRRTTVEYLFDRLEQESFAGQRAKRTMCTALLALLLLELARSEGERGAPVPPATDRSAKKIVESMGTTVRESLAHSWTLAEMVKRSGYSSTQLNVLFRRATGLSPCQWISQERVHRACQLLAHSEQTVIQIAGEVGFGTRSQFHRVFRKATGTTPERYRSALQHEGQS